MEDFDLSKGVRVAVCGYDDGLYEGEKGTIVESRPRLRVKFDDTYIGDKDFEPMYLVPVEEYERKKAAAKRAMAAKVAALAEKKQTLATKKQNRQSLGDKTNRQRPSLEPEPQDADEQERRRAQQKEERQRRQQEEERRRAQAEEERQRRQAQEEDERRRVQEEEERRRRQKEAEERRAREEEERRCMAAEEERRRAEEEEERQRHQQDRERRAREEEERLRREEEERRQQEEEERRRAQQEPPSTIIKLKLIRVEGRGNQRRRFFHGLELGTGQWVDVTPSWIRENRYDHLVAGLTSKRHIGSWVVIQPGKASPTPKDPSSPRTMSDDDDDGCHRAPLCTGGSPLPRRVADDDIQVDATIIAGAPGDDASVVKFQQGDDDLCALCAGKNAFHRLGDDAAADAWEDFFTPTQGLGKQLMTFAQTKLGGYDARPLPIPKAVPGQTQNRQFRGLERKTALLTTAPKLLESANTAIAAVVLDEVYAAAHAITVHQGKVDDSNKKKALTLVDWVSRAVHPEVLDACVVGGGRCLGIHEAILLTKTKKRKPGRQGKR